MPDGTYTRVILKDLVDRHMAAALKAREIGAIEFSERMMRNAIYYQDQIKALELAEKAKVNPKAGETRLPKRMS